MEDTPVKDAITYLTANHYERLVIDVTGNGGRYVGLGIDTVHQLFPCSPTVGTQVAPTGTTGGSIMRRDRKSRACRSSWDMYIVMRITLRRLCGVMSRRV